METPKTLREVKDFLNKVDEKFLDRTFSVQEENEMHYVHFLDVAEEDMYHDPETPENGNMTLADWKEFLPDSPIEGLKIGIPKGAPMIGEDF